MNRGSTNFLRAVIVCIGLTVLALCVFALPRGITSELENGADFDYGVVFMGLYVSAIPFFFALHQAERLLGYIDQNKAFSELSIKALKNIKYCALLISGLFAVGMPYIFYLADKDDAPGVALVGFIIIGASLVIATFAGVLQKLLQNAADLKSENDLTV